MISIGNQSYIFLRIGINNFLKLIVQIIYHFIFIHLQVFKQWPAKYRVSKRWPQQIGIRLRANYEILIRMLVIT